jgi:uncharacterized iron-regulated protein
MNTPHRIIPLFALIFLMMFAGNANAAATCVDVGQWLRPDDRTTVTHRGLMAELAKRPVVLLGEVHTNNEHHRWQLHTLAALHALNPNMVIAFEAFPRSTQSVLDKWVRGELGIGAFLKQSRWYDVWRFDANQYLPLFHFARQHKIPMVAMNVERKLIRAVGKQGFENVPKNIREGVGKPAPAAKAYRKSLREVFEAHQKIGIGSPHKPKKHGTKAAPAPKDSVETRFDRFVQVQTTWDRAMAEALYKARTTDSAPLVVGIVGMGHLEFGHGISYQLTDLGLKDAAVLLPWGSKRTCGDLKSAEGVAIAEVVFGIKPVQELAQKQKPKLGVMISTVKQKVLINRVLKDSIAEASGIIDGDRVLEAAGVKIHDTATLVSIIQRQAPGTWLPLLIDRKGEKSVIIAKFPAKSEN